MKSVFVLCGVIGAVANASACQADENSLLQSKKSVRKHAQADSQALLKKMQEVANSLLEGSDTTMTEDEVNDALEHAQGTIADLEPAIRQQIQTLQQQINDAAGAVRVCHAQEQLDLRSNLRDYVQQRYAAVESCQETLRHFQTDADRQCRIAEDCLCDEARQRATDQETLCQAMTETYEAAFCEHHHVCTIFRDCHASEAEVFAGLRSDAEAELAIIVTEYQAVEQSECLVGLSLQSMMQRPRRPISHAALIACSDVDVSGLRIDYPNLPATPAACPAHQHGQPQCVSGALSGYEHHPARCVHGHNIRKVTDSTPAQCAELCDAESTCVGFEFGVDYGASGRYNPNDCQLQNGARYNNCNGRGYNLDFYEKLQHD